MSISQRGTRSSLDHALSLEREYDWRGAAEAYEKALRLASESRTPLDGDILERKAYALYRAAFQADSNEEFKTCIDSAIDEFERAKLAYSGSTNETPSPLAIRCEAMISLSKYNRTSDGVQKKDAILRSWMLATQSLDGLEKTGNGPEFARTCDVLEGAAALSFAYSGSAEEMRNLTENALRYCERAIELLQTSNEDERLARAYISAARHTTLSRFMSQPSKKEKLDRRALELVMKGLETNHTSAIEKIARDFYDVGLPRSIPVEEEDRLLDEVYKRAYAMRDHLAIGIAFEWQSALKGYECHESTDSDQGRLSADESYNLAIEAGRHFSIVSHAAACATPIATWFCEDGYCLLLALAESDLCAKRRHAIRGLELHDTAVRVAEHLAMPEHLCDTKWSRAMLLNELAKTEEDAVEKRKLLAQARICAMEYGEGLKALHPLDSFLGGANWILALAECELAELATDVDEKRLLLSQGITHAGESYQGLLDNLFDWNKDLAHLFLGRSQYLRGELCLALYDISHDEADLDLASESFEKAAEMHRTGGQPSRVAESLWKAAISYGTRGDHAKSSERFSRAGETFRQAAEELPRLRKFYEDHALYMDAWAELEHARHHHKRQEHGPAKESYERAASLLAKTQRWNVFSTNYAAWSLIEKAEDLSRSDSNEESAEAFQEASRLLTESKNTISTALKTMEHKEESEIAAKLIVAADLRRDYCTARVAIEKAKTLDRSGHESASAESYAEAARTLELVLERVETDQDKKDLRLVLTLTRAWQRMTEAEGTVNPGLFGEAAVLFGEAKDLSPDKNAKLLAAGHSRFCKALQAGMEFSDTGEASLHAEATKHLESAAKYYLKAGFQSASDYANASKLLFDGYVHMNRASKEENQEKKAKLFTLAEKVLEASASSYERSQYPGKKDQIMKLLEKVRRDRELAISLTKALQAPDIVSATTSFSAPTQIQETAVGTDRFEHADIQAAIIARPVDLKVGDDFRLEIELVNAGRGSAQLTKVERVIPQGFDLVAEPERYRIEDSYLNMKGRRLDTLKTEDVRLVLKPTVHGEFTLKPRIMYLDESGKYKSCEPEPVSITVRELGISGWLKGPEKTR
jgi:tetratricopeptide (TPR) repeat protein